MDKKYQIFISSTFKDLKDERRRVTEAILNLGHIPVGMELFQAGDETQWDYIKQSINEADYYVLIVGERYGSEVDGKSYTQMEYEYAVEQSVPVAAFLLDNDARNDWPSGRVEHDKRHKVDAFRALCETRLVQYWSDEKDLALKVNTALSHLFRRNPQVGWVRANTVPSSRALEEIAQLSEEKRSLQKKVDEFTTQSGGIGYDERRRLEELSRSPSADLLELPHETANMDMLTLYMTLHRALSIGQTDRELRRKIRQLYSLRNEEKFNMDAVMAEFSRLHLVEFDIENGMRNYWLTDYGKDIALDVPIWRSESGDSAA